MKFWLEIFVAINNTHFFVLLGNKRMVGDILTLGSALMFGIVHVGLQHSVYFYNSSEFLGCIGLFGTIITIIQM